MLASGLTGPVVHDAGARPLPPGVQPVSGHALGAASAIELARALGSLPRRLYVVGIPAHSFGIGDPVSPRTREAVDESLATVRLLVSRMARSGSANVA